jgi:hypothetical protein
MSDMFQRIGPMGGVMGAARPVVVARRLEPEQDDGARDDEEITRIPESGPVIARRARRGGSVRNPSIIG